MDFRRQTSLAMALALGLVASLALAGVVAAAPTTLSAELTGVGEGDMPGDEDGTGSATVTLDPETGEACWELTAENIGPVGQSHIHVGAEGESGGVAVPLDVEGFDGTSEGCVSDQDADVLQAIIDDPAGYYVNLHTEEFPAGAVRGQLAASGGEEQPDTALPMRDASGVVLLGLVLLALSLTLALGHRRPAAQRD